MNIKAIIAEDEQKNRENLRQLLLKHCPGIDIIDCCSSAAEAYEIIVSLQPELVFLDIEMPGSNGFLSLPMTTMGYRPSNSVP